LPPTCGDAIFPAENRLYWGNTAIRSRRGSVGGKDLQVAKILVVDDDSLVRASLRTALEYAGHEVVEAANGREGVDFFRGMHADLVITNIVMPEMDGLEEIKELERTNPEIKIIVISGYDDRDGGGYLDLAQKYGAQRTFTKPFDVGEVETAVRELLGEKEGMTEDGAGGPAAEGEKGQEETAIWSPKYELGIPLIDGQHKRLVDEMEALLKSMKGRRTGKSVQECLDFLDIYTSEHFHTEERLMRQQGYPDLEAHLKAHQYFRDTVAKAQTFINLNPGSVKSLQLVQSMVINWFLKHIKGTDQKYVPMLGR
jgi:hemerythrin-like metal-binding protein